MAGRIGELRLNGIAPCHLPTAPSTILLTLENNECCSCLWGCAAQSPRMIVNSRVTFPLIWLPSTTTTTTTSTLAGKRFARFPVASNDCRINTEELRTQLDQLHAEAEITRHKANNARLRLMRLSEAAENLQRRAATNVVVGKETEAWQMLVQKKKLMQALEKSKNRIDVLDKLSAKINEAISLKETQLIGNVAKHPEVSREDTGHQIRFIYPKDVIHDDSVKTDVFDQNRKDSGESQELAFQTHDACLPADSEQPVIDEADSVDISNYDNEIGGLKGISSYDGFLGYVDEQLREVETDLVGFLRLSDLILESEQRQMNTKVQRTSEILKDVRRIRGRIASIIKSKLDES